MKGHEAGYLTLWCLRILFRTSDLSSVRLYVQQQFSRIMQNRVSPQDFIYAKEVKMGSYS